MLPFLLQRIKIEGELGCAQPGGSSSVTSEKLRDGKRKRREEGGSSREKQGSDENGRRRRIDLDVGIEFAGPSGSSDSNSRRERGGE